MSGPQSAGTHDQRHRRQARRECARDRHRLGRADRPTSPTSPTMPTRSRSSSRWASARAACRLPTVSRVEKALHRVTSTSRARSPTAITAWGRGGALRKIHRDLRNRPCAAAANASSYKAGGMMVITVGPPGEQRVLKVAKTHRRDGSITTSRYGGTSTAQDRAVVPFTQARGTTRSSHDTIADAPGRRR